MTNHDNNQWRTRSFQRRDERRSRALRYKPVSLLLLLLLTGEFARAQYQHTEYEVKAVYLYQFGKFVRWPDSTSQAFPICVLGYDPFGETLDSTVRGETVDGKQLSVRRISSAEQASGCRILFVSSSEQHRLVNDISALDDRPVLTVSDIPGFCDRGGMIEFKLEGERVRFVVNRAPAERAGLTLSSDLLRVALLVKDNRPGP